MAPTDPSYSIWAQEDYDSPDLMLDCLLPNGIIIQMTVPKDALICTIKLDLLAEARKYPLFHLLKQNADVYVFTCVNEVAVRVELEDETRRLCDVRPFSPLLRLIESPKHTSQQNRTEKIINAQISILMGKGLHELDSIQDPEVIDFRNHMRKMCERIAREKESQEWLERAMCYFPPELSPLPKLPPYLLTRLEGGNLRILVRIGNPEVSSYTFQINVNAFPEDLVRMTLDKRAKTMGESIPDASQFVLKVCGLQEYLLGHFPLAQFMYIRRSITKAQIPEVIVVSQESALDYKPPIVPRGKRDKAATSHPSIEPPSREQERLLSSGHCLFNLTDNFCITVGNISNVSMCDYLNVKVRACLYHGGDTLCSSVSSKDTMLTQGCAKWGEMLTFDLQLQNVPRMARLCFVLYMLPDKRSGKKTPTARKLMDKKKEMMPLAWVNIPVFDYKGTLRSDDQKKLYMWTLTDDDVLTDELVNPIGTVESNPQTDEAVCLTISFHKYNLDGPIYYPLFDKVMEVAAQHSKFASDEQDALARLGINKDHMEALKAMVDRDPLHQLHEQEKELIWTQRYDCREHFPHALPKLLSCVHWNNYADVATMQALLQIWQPIPPTEALELLDFQYADKAVRKFAVECLKNMSDSELCQYLLQFIQVLKYESYLECDLIEFLLQRALNNHKIGHFFFWLLRSEMHVPSVSVRFGLILEAYFRGNTALLSELSKEVEALNSLRSLNDHLKNCSLPKEKLKEELRKGLEKKYLQSLTDLKCTLNPTIKLKSLSMEQCRVMDSKMRPLWLVWENADLYGLPLPLMYKRGDDLRQDMLSLQILHIMDNIWQSEGLDFRLNPYGCLPTGHNEGLIEIVTKASTLATIQRAYSDIKLKAAFNKQCLYQWLKKHNQDPKSFNSAMNEFLMSCAGYCVATYVLGVADRHSDNIMLRENGQLFHIDFGHILGHFKSKMGVKRERVPFVLTSDFVYVITRGPEQSNESFIKFKMLCQRAFQILRQHSKFLITLFMMMMNTGIQEVSCIRDIEYLKETLVPHMTDEEADSHFLAKFNEALKNSWKTSVDWMFHIMNH